MPGVFPGSLLRGHFGVIGLNPGWLCSSIAPSPGIIFLFLNRGNFCKQKSLLIPRLEGMRKEEAEEVWWSGGDDPLVFPLSVLSFLSYCSLLPSLI